MLVSDTTQSNEETAKRTMHVISYTDNLTKSHDY